MAPLERSRLIEPVSTTVALHDGPSAGGVEGAPPGEGSIDVGVNALAGETGAEVTPPDEPDPDGTTTDATMEDLGEEPNARSRRARSATISTRCVWVDNACRDVGKTAMERSQTGEA